MRRRAADALLRHVVRSIRATALVRAVRSEPATSRRNGRLNGAQRRCGVLVVEGSLRNIVIILADNDPSAWISRQPAPTTFRVGNFDCSLIGVRRLARYREQKKMVNASVQVIGAQDETSRPRLASLSFAAMVLRGPQIGVGNDRSLRRDLNRHPRHPCLR